MRIRTTIPALVVAAAALLALAPSALAKSYALRPTATAAGGGWTATPAGSDIAAALADDVTQPAAPATGTDFVTSPSNGNSWTAVGVSAPTLAQGENITGVTAWAYVGTGSTRSASLALYSNDTLLGWALVPSGQAPRWYAIPTATPPTADRAAHLYLVLSSSGNASTAVKAFAAYVDLETDAVDQQGSSAPAAAPGQPAGTGSGSDGTTAGGSPTAMVASLAPVAALTAKRSGVVQVPVSCPAVRVFGCTGTVTIESLGSASRSHAKLATEARRRKILLRSRRHFKLAAGVSTKIPVVLDRRTARLVRHNGRVRARVTVSTDIGDGKQAVSVRNVTLRERRIVRKTQKKASPRGGRSRH